MLTIWATAFLLGRLSAPAPAGIQSHGVSLAAEDCRAIPSHAVASHVMPTAKCHRVLGGLSVPRFRPGVASVAVPTAFSTAVPAACALASQLHRTCISVHSTSHMHCASQEKEDAARGVFQSAKLLLASGTRSSALLARSRDGRVPAWPMVRQHC